MLFMLFYFQTLVCILGVPSPESMKRGQGRKTVLHSMQLDTAGSSSKGLSPFQAWELCTSWLVPEAYFARCTLN